MAQTGSAELFRQDYLAYCRQKPGESPARRRLLMVPRVLVNPGLRAVLSLRLANASPRWTGWLWRNYFVMAFSMDWAGPFEAGPGLDMPHPIGICIVTGARIGADVGVGQHVTLGGAPDGGRPVIGDRVTLYPGAVVIGGVSVGDDSVVVANSVVMRDVPPASMVTPRGVIPRDASRYPGDRTIP